VLRHADARVCSLPLHSLASNFPHAFLLISVATPTIRMAFPPRLAALPKFRSDPGCRSNPIAHRVRRKRQRLPPSLLIENASDQDPRSTPKACPEALPIKASDNPSGIARLAAKVRNNDIALGKRPGGRVQSCSLSQKNLSGCKWSSTSRVVSEIGRHDTAGSIPSKSTN